MVSDAIAILVRMAVLLFIIELKKSPSDQFKFIPQNQLITTSQKKHVSKNCTYNLSGRRL